MVMKALSLLLIASFVLAENGVTIGFIESVKASGATWEVTSYEENIFKGWTTEELKSLLGVRKDLFSLSQVETEDASTLPEEFDWRKKMERCVHPIRDQARCGSCWAFAATGALSDRFCIKNKDVILSPQDLVSCDPVDRGCQGGGDITPYTYMATYGALAESCFPYVSGDGRRRFCISECVDKTKPFVKYYCDEDGAIVKGLESTQKREILENGPVSTAFTVFRDFMTYKSGIYYPVSDEEMGGHAVKVVGWGVESGVKYWICANSWSERWGEKGYFKIKMGVCDVMDRGVSCIPLIESAETK